MTVYFLIPALNVLIAALIFVILRQDDWRRRPLVEKLPVAIIAADLALAAALFIADPQDWQRWILSKEMVVSIAGATYVAIVLISRRRSRHS